MQHRFSVELAIVAMVSVISAGYLAAAMQSASALSSEPFSGGTEVSEVAEDTIARTHTRSRGRGTGRRGVLG
ncbi:MAG: hypothetical protein ACFCVB_11185 [Nodosilinea sp.]